MGKGVGEGDGKGRGGEVFAILAASSTGILHDVFCSWGLRSRVIRKKQSIGVLEK